jgi:hypothetical protein
VYYDWVDACDAVAKEARGGKDKEPVPPRLLRGGGGPGDENEVLETTERYDDDDGFVVDDEPDAEFGEDD